MLEVLRLTTSGTASHVGLRERMWSSGTRARRLLPVVFIHGPVLAFLLTGTVVVERIFALPGLGNYLIQASLNRDEPLILGIVSSRRDYFSADESPGGHRLRLSGSEDSLLRATTYLSARRACGSAASQCGKALRYRRTLIEARLRPCQTGGVAQVQTD